MKKKRGRNERTRLILLELAVVLPAVALIGFSIAHLQSIQRDGAVEAAIQRDFQQVLAISEKQMNSRILEMAESARADFAAPDGDTQGMLQRVLEHNPEVAHAFLYDPKEGNIFLSRAERMGEPDFQYESKKDAEMMRAWFPADAKPLMKKLRDLGKKMGHPVYFFYDSAPRDKGELYQLFALFPVKDVPHDHLTIAGVAFDADYLKDSFFPQQLNEQAECPNNKAQDNAQNHPALILRSKMDDSPLAKSANWDGGSPEVERKLEYAFPGLVLGIKYPGTTIKAISDRFMRNSYLILGALSLLMAGGIFLSYRSVNKEMAVAKLKSDFVSNVSHELRTPLALIRLYAETLELGRITTPEKHEEYYRIIRKESERLTALINNILDFSRIEAGRKEYDFRETDLAELVRTTLDSYRFQIEQQGFVLEEHIPDDLPPIPVDREAIARSLLNLVNNAVKYSAKDKFLAVNMYRANGAVRLEVVDRGIGIPRHEQGKIFEKFYRASDPLVHNTKGSGLGLSLVRHVVEAHGGQVSVDSTPGRGSKFIISLPVQPAAKTARMGLAS
jgi:signal transduction histidine kinase